ESPQTEAPEPSAEPVAAPEDQAEPNAAPEAEAAAAEKPNVPEIEVFYTFTWGRNPNRNRPQGARKPGQKPGGKGKPRHDGKRDRKGKQGGQERAKNYSARPPRKEKQIDPDNPFAAALMGLKDKK
ncbi:MAG: disulfide oxidoreductase, partial [Arenibacterium sp.]